MNFEELRVKLAELEDDYETAQRELGTLARRQERIERLEEDAQEVMRSYAGTLHDNLRTLDPKERHEIYRMLRLRIAAYPDGILLASGVLGEAEPVYTPGTTSRCCGPSTHRSGLLTFSSRLSGSDEPEELGLPSLIQ